MKLKWIVMFAALLLPAMAVAADMSHGESKPLVKTGEVDGYSISYHMRRDEQSDGKFNLIAKVERDGKSVELLKAVSKVITSDGQALMKKMKQHGDSYVSSFDLNELGQNQIMIQFKTVDEKNHFIGGWYPGMDQEQ